MASLYNDEIPDTYLSDVSDKVTVEQDCYRKKNRRQLYYNDYNCTYKGKNKCLQCSSVLGRVIIV